MNVESILYFLSPVALKALSGVIGPKFQIKN